MNIYEKRNSILGMEFDRYIRENPKFADNIPSNAQVILLLEGDEDFNEWSNRIGKEQVEKGKPIAYISIKKMAPVRSRIKEIELIS